MQPVVEESTAADSEAETETQAETQAERGAKALISDIPDDAFGHILFWLPPLTNLAAARVAKQWRVRRVPSVSLKIRDNSRGYSRPLYTTSTSLCMTRTRVGTYRFSSPSRGTSAETKNAP